jgi:Flp pilus assembly protein TadG
VSARRQQQGVVAIIVVVALFAVAALAGLAMDGSHFGTNKARLQGIVDAAALAGAKALDDSGSTATATAAATQTFNVNAGQFPELSRVRGGVQLVVEYSSTVAPFAPGTTPERYVRVVASNFRTDTTLLRITGRESANIRASAVAGPSPAIGSACNIAPLLLCGDPAAGPPNFGYAPDSLQVIKIGSNAGSPVGPGNFQLLRLDGNGASVVRENLAGGYEGCATTGTSVETQTGNLAGPVAQGLNTRFGEYSGGGVSASQYPPDVVTRQPSPQLQYNRTTEQITQGGQTVTTAADISYNHSRYSQDVASGSFNNAPRPGGTGVYARRELAVPVGNCSGVNNGNSTLPVLGFACLFLIQTVEQSGIESFVYGQFLRSCEAGGRPGPAPVAGPGPYIIQLYRDPASADS